MPKSFDKMIADIPKRFESFYIPEPNSGCWLWLGKINKYGYGCFTIGKRGTFKTTCAHTISYIIHKQKVPAGELDHLCRLRCCVNPDHLEDVSHRENMRRGFWAQKPACVNGHLFTVENTYTWGGKRRQCRVCNAQSVAAYRKRKIK